MRTCVLFTAIGLMAAGTALGGDCGVAGPAACGAAGCEAAQGSRDCGDCPHCGCRMVCKSVCTVKEVKKTVWVVKCEPFCAPLPGCGHGCRCGCGDSACGGCGAEQGGEGACSKCGDCNPCAVEEAKRQVPPKCGPVRCRKILEKKEIVCKVPTYKCVPTCPQCDCGGNSGCDGGAVAPPRTERTPAPAPAPGKTTQRAPTPPVLNASYVK
jgi:hypothetical protein